MSQKATRKSQNATPVTDEKEQVDTPVKEMKKKIAANAEKDKQAAEKTDKPADKAETADKNKATEKPEKNGEKPDKNEKQDNKDKAAEKKTDKTEKVAEKKTDKTEKVAEKKTDKTEKVAEKKPEKSDKKTDKPVEKKLETQPEKDESKGEKSKEKQQKQVNGCHNGAASNGDDANGTVSDGSDVELVIEEDEMFPELTYDDSDTDADEAPSRSLTRRSQVKATKTPDTPAPRPASERDSDTSKESKLLKLKDDTASSDRKLRSADSPKPESKKKDSPKKQDSAQEDDKVTKKDAESTKKDLESEREKKEQKDGKTEEKSDKMEVEIVVEAESTEGMTTRTRARVSPYTRTRLDRTVTSVMADYTGNNSTMEMDITESSSILEDPSLNDSGYLRGLRGIRGRSSYKLLKELKLTNPNANRPRPPPTATTTRPTGAVVGRKRKPSSDSPPSPPERVEAGEEASEDMFLAHGKRMKLLDRLSMPFRRSLPRRAAEIVGINTDLPLTAPVASTSFATFDPESIKPAPLAPAPGEPLATPLPTLSAADRDTKRCILM